MTSTLNGTFIRDQRIKHSISRTVAADLLGVRRVVLQRIEANDPDAVRQVPLNGLLILAEALGCRPGDLFHDQKHTDIEAPAEPAHGETAATLLSGFLLAKQTQVTIKDVSRALNWTRRDVHAAKDALQTLLEGTGIRLSIRADTLHLVPDHATAVAHAMQASTKSTADRRGVNDGVARVLRLIIDGDLNPSGHHKTFTRNAVVTLTTIGALKPDETSPVPSQALLYALGRSE